ncbi:MAG: hypothetical protein JWM99_20 [Verrucomicrobiales bacterium]|jgi:hypothetical protein|nr:hypothetical protein [Verrucomicrobiales bacterium]
MKNRITNPLLILTILVAATFSAALQAQIAAPSAPAGQQIATIDNELIWPREFLDNGTKLSIYHVSLNQ